MTLFETLGFIWIVFTSCYGTFLVGRAVVRDLTRSKRLELRGYVEELQDQKRAADQRWLEGIERGK